MMFLAMIPEDYNPRPRHRALNFLDTGYPLTDKDKLKSFRCPICKEHNLFRSYVFICCSGCVNYFSEKDIIEENIMED